MIGYLIPCLNPRSNGSRLTFTYALRESTSLMGAQWLPGYRINKSHSIFVFMYYFIPVIVKADYIAEIQYIFASAFSLTTILGSICHFFLSGSGKTYFIL